VKTEGEFNAWMSKEYKRRSSQGVYALKVSDRFQVGIADFIVWRNGKSVAHENKAISDFPKTDKLILKHVFDGAQTTWLETFELAGNRSYGIIVVLKLGKFYVFDRKHIPLSGNFKMSEFDAIPKKVFNIDNESFEEFLGEHL